MLQLNRSPKYFFHKIKVKVSLELIIFRPRYLNIFV